MTDYARHNTTLDDTTVAILKAYGGGNLSEGIRRAAELVRATESLSEARKAHERFKNEERPHKPTWCAW